jgi:hypothetical protein
MGIMKTKFAAYQQQHNEPNTFGEFLTTNAIKAIRDLFEPFHWLKSFFSYIKLQVIRLWNKY